MFSRPGRSPVSTDPAASTQRDPKQLLRLLAFARPYRGLFVVGVLATLLSTGLGLVFPMVFGKLIDASFLKVGSSNTAQLDQTVVTLLGIFLLSACFSAAQSYLLATVGSGVVADLRRALLSHLLGLSPRFFGDHKTGELTSRLTSDVSSVQAVTSTALAQAISMSLSLVGSVVLLFVTSVRLSLITLVIIPAVIGTAILIGRQLRRMARQLQDTIAAANADAAEALGGIREVQSFTAEAWESDRYSQGMARAFGIAKIRNRWQALMTGAMSFLTFGALALVLWYGGRQVMAGQMTPGNLVTFLFYAFQVGGTVAGLTGIFNQFQEALGASSRIFELLDEQADLPEPPRPIPLKLAEGQVDFENVSFRYGGQDVLRGVNFRVPAGQIVALVGPSGAGKTTLVNLIPRFWDVSSGVLRVDGRDVHEYSLSDLRSQVGLVPQETLLFSGTIAENIRYGRPNAGHAEVEAAALAANAHNFISAFEKGYDTVVGERGVKLSGGQRQRIAMARAILKDPRILILDEATSALDNESEVLVQAALERLMVGRTTFVIAHRLSTIRHADRILVIDAGQVQADGTHTELLAAGGLYRDLYELQFRQEQHLLERR